MKSLIKLAFKTLITLSTILLVGYFVWIYVIPKLSEHDSRQHDTKQSDFNQKDKYSVEKVIDGDTFEIDAKDANGKFLKVRLLGVEIPDKPDTDKITKDSVNSAKNKQLISRNEEQAGKYVRRLLEGKKVFLVAENNYDDKDKSGRLLRYVYLEDGTFINIKLVEEGYAKIIRKINFSKKDDFIKAENTAKQQKKGIWAVVN